MTPRPLTAILPLLLTISCTADKGSDDSGDEVVDCSTRELVVPSPRGEVAGVWDAANGRLVIFGGDEGMPENCRAQPEFLSETWAFSTDCDSFEQLTEEGPTPRTRSAVTLDRERNRMIVHGGRFRDGLSGRYDMLNDMWALDLGTDTWRQLSTEGGPTARVNHAMVVAGDVLVLYGGNTSPDGTAYRSQTDLWTFDMVTEEWNRLEARAEPGARQFHAMTVSSAGDKAWVYAGGGDGAFFGEFFEDLWELDLGTYEWTLLHEGGRDAPTLRIWPNMELHEPSNRLVMWGGHDDSQLAAPTNELWAYDLADNTWERLQAGDEFNRVANAFCDYPADFTTVDVSAPERRYASAAAMTDSGELITFGGKTDCGQINDVWSYNFDSNLWTERSAATFGEVCLRAFSEGCDTMCG